MIPLLLPVLCAIALTPSAKAATNPPVVLWGGGKLLIATNRSIAHPETLTTTAGISQRERSDQVSFALVDPQQGETSDEQPIAVRPVDARQIGEVLSRASGNPGAAPHSALVYVHGFDNTTESAVHVAVQVANKMNFTGDVIVFAWPSLGSLSPANYRADAGTADASKDAFSQLLRALQASQPIARIDVIAHSLGNRILIRSLLAGAPPSKLAQLVLCSPDVERSEFKQSVPRITAFVQGATLWVSNNDNVLVAAPTFGGGEARAGLIETGGEPIVLPQLATIDVSEETALFALNHNAYVQVNDLFSDLAQVFDLSALRPWLNPAKRQHYIATQTSDSQIYWKYKQ